MASSKQKEPCSRFVAVVTVGMAKAICVVLLFLCQFNRFDFADIIDCHQNERIDTCANHRSLCFVLGLVCTNRHGVNAAYGLEQLGLLWSERYGKRVQ